MKIWIISHTPEGTEIPFIYLSNMPTLAQLNNLLQPFINKTEHLEIICSELLRYGRHNLPNYVPLNLYSVEVIENGFC